MASYRDSQRFRKVYSYFRPIPKPENPAVTESVYIESRPMLCGTVTSTQASGTMESVGMTYINQTAVDPSANSYYFNAILACTAGTVAYVDLYDYNGIVNGSPGPISGSVLTGSSQSFTYLQADLTSTFNKVTGSGIIEARIWCDPTGPNLAAICKGINFDIVWS